jgi:UDP-3-O-[3-hydroxymyristoyl] glucosamine N-acyltransferase
MQIKDLLDAIKPLEFIGNPEQIIQELVPLESGQQHPNSLCWCSDAKQAQLTEITSGAVICSPRVDRALFQADCHYLLVEQPRQAFRDVLKLFIEPAPCTIASSARIAEDAEIADAVSIGHNVVIESGVKIGTGTRIGHNTVIMARTRIGSQVQIGSNNTIGNVGFGYEPNAEGIYEVLPHLGRVVIEDFVEIGNNTCIDRAVLGSTLIRRHAKIDNLVHIAHGVEIGENALIIANAMVAGSVKVGAHAWIAPSSSILNQKSVGARAVVGLGAVVIRDVPEDDIVAGNPAKSLKKTSG